MKIETGAFTFEYDERDKNLRPDQLLKFPGRDLLLLDEDIKNLPGEFCYYSSALSLCEKRLTDAKDELRFIMARTLMNIRAVKKATREKTTEVALQEEVFVHPDVTQARRTMMQIELEYNLLKNFCAALQKKQDIYQTMCNNIRRETPH